MMSVYCHQGHAAGFSFCGQTMELVVTLDVPLGSDVPLAREDFSQCNDLTNLQDFSDGFLSARKLLAPWKWLVGWCSASNCCQLQNLVERELRLLLPLRSHP